MEIFLYEKNGREGERFMVKWESLICRLGLCWGYSFCTWLIVVWICHAFCWTLSSTEVNWRSFTESGGHSCPGEQSQKAFMSTTVFSRSFAGMSLDCVILCTQLQISNTRCCHHMPSICKRAKKKGFHLALWLWQRAKNTLIDLLQINYMGECVSQVTKYFQSIQGIFLACLKHMTHQASPGFICFASSSFSLVLE